MTSPIPTVATYPLGWPCRCHLGRIAIPPPMSTTPEYEAELAVIRAPHHATITDQSWGMAIYPAAT